MTINIHDLLTVHTNKITSNSQLVQNILDLSPIKDKTLPIKQHLYHILHNTDVISTCNVCSISVKWDNKNLKYPITCSRKCSNLLKSKDLNIQQKRKITNQIKYGGVAPACNASIIQKIKSTNLARYGAHYTKINAYKSKKKILEKYNVENISQLEFVKIKKRNSSFSKFGVDHPMQNIEVNSKFKKTLQEKYGVYNINQLHIPTEILLKFQDYNFLYTQHILEQKSLSRIAKETGVSIYTVYRYLKMHKIENMSYQEPNQISQGQQEIIDFIKSLGIEEIHVNDRIQIYPKELDIYLPEYKLAIEYNGIFWHSEIFKPSTYHLHKTRDCEHKGIRLIHIMEDEWRDMQQQCKETLQHLLNKSERGVYARNTTIREISWKQAKQFLNRYHLLGAGACGSHRIGAFDKLDRLIGVMVFGRQTNERTNQIELKRFVTDKRNNPGLGTKMFKHAVQLFGLTNVVAFVDRRWFTGLVKNFIGFQQIDETKPTLWWTDGYYRKNRRFITKTKIQNIGINISKRVALEAFGYVRIWDCGKIKLRWVRDKYFV